MDLLLARAPSPIGEILLVHDRNGSLRALDFQDYEARMHRLFRLHYGEAALRPAPAPPAITDALQAYFQGVLNALDLIPVATGGTIFQRAVWAALRGIAPGSVTSYGAIARRIGAPKAVRAVGAANGANPIGIVVPCHRVIGATGKLTGYGGGLERKAYLLKHEGFDERHPGRFEHHEAMLPAPS